MEGRGEERRGEERRGEERRGEERRGEERRGERRERDRERKQDKERDTEKEREIDRKRLREIGKGSETKKETNSLYRVCYFAEYLQWQQIAHILNISKIIVTARYTANTRKP